MDQFLIGTGRTNQQFTQQDRLQALQRTLVLSTFVPIIVKTHKYILRIFAKKSSCYLKKYAKIDRLR